MHCEDGQGCCSYRNASLPCRCSAHDPRVQRGSAKQKLARALKLKSRSFYVILLEGAQLYSMLRVGHRCRWCRRASAVSFDESLRRGYKAIRPLLYKVNSSAHHIIIIIQLSHHNQQSSQAPRTAKQALNTAITKPTTTLHTAPDCYTQHPQTCLVACNSPTRRPLLWRMPKISHSNTHTHNCCPFTWE